MNMKDKTFFVSLKLFYPKKTKPSCPKHQKNFAYKGLEAS